MAPVTEFLGSALKPGTSIGPGTEAGKILDNAIATLKQQPGMQRIYHGTDQESPNTIHMFIDWESLDAHKTFQAKPEYEPFLKTFTGLLEGEPKVFHAQLDPFPPSGPLTSPTTEVFVSHFQPDITEEDEKDFAGRFRKLVAALEAEAPGNGYKGVATGGWTVERLPHAGKQCKAFMGTIGWESRKAHMDFRDTDAFAKAIPVMREGKGIMGTDMFHISCQDSGPSSG